MVVFAVTILLVVALAALVGMAVGWKHRSARTESYLGSSLDIFTAPADPGAVHCGPLACTYVSTTSATDWLDRVTAHGLGDRSSASLSVADAGVVIERSGSTDLFVPAGYMLSARAERAIAGKVMGTQALVVLTWSAGEHELETGVLPRHKGDRDLIISAVESLIDSASSRENA